MGIIPSYREIKNRYVRYSESILFFQSWPGDGGKRWQHYVVTGVFAREAITQSILTHRVGRYARHCPPAPGSLGSAALSRTLRYINDNLDGNISIEAMADIAGLSPFHFSRSFARATGHSPHRYVMLARVERAAALLRGSSLSLAEIAFQTGFADQSHMARHVRQRHGISPKALRLAGTYNYRGH
jgi:AraC family transcriptional regulator